MVRGMRRFLLPALVVALPACTANENTTYGVSPGPNDAPRIHYALCQGDRIWRVRLDSYQGGSQPGIVLPIFWEIQSPEGSRKPTYDVGVPPSEFQEIVPFVAPFPTGMRDLIAIDGPREGLGMSFDPKEDLRRGLIYVGSYRYLSQAAFDSRAHRYCLGRLVENGVGGAMLLLLGLLILALARANVRETLPRLVTRLAVLLLGAFFFITLAGASDTLLRNAYYSFGDFFSRGLVSLIITSVYLVPVGVFLALLAEFPRDKWSMRVRRTIVATLAGVVGTAFILLLEGSTLSVVMAAGAGAILGVLITLKGGDASAAEEPRGRRRLVTALVLASIGGALGLLFDVGQGSVGLAVARWRGDLVNIPSDPSRPPQIPPNEAALTEITGTPSDALSVIEVSFESSGAPHTFYVDCSGVSIQISETYYVEPTQYGSRVVAPCGGEPIETQFSKIAPEGETVGVYGFPNGIRDWRVVVAAAE